MKTHRKTPHLVRRINELLLKKNAVGVSAVEIAEEVRRELLPVTTALLLIEAERPTLLGRLEEPENYWVFEDVERAREQLEAILPND